MRLFDDMHVLLNCALDRTPASVHKVADDKLIVCNEVKVASGNGFIVRRTEVHLTERRSKRVNVLIKMYAFYETAGTTVARLPTPRQVTLPYELLDLNNVIGTFYEVMLPMLFASRLEFNINRVNAGLLYSTTAKVLTNEERLGVVSTSQTRELPEIVTLTTSSKYMAPYKTTRYVHNLHDPHCPVSALLSFMVGKECRMAAGAKVTFVEASDSLGIYFGNLVGRNYKSDVEIWIGEDVRGKTVLLHNNRRESKRIMYMPVDAKRDLCKIYLDTNATWLQNLSRYIRC